MSKFIQKLLTPYGIQPSKISKMEGYASENYLIEDNDNRKYVFKYHRNPGDRNTVQAENKLQLYLAESVGLNVSKPISLSHEVHVYDDLSFSRLLDYVPGTFLAEADQNIGLARNFGSEIGNIVSALSSFTNDTIQGSKHLWDLTHILELRSWTQYITDPSIKKLVDHCFDQYQINAADQILSCPDQIIHGDLNDWNVLVQDGKISGIIDFGDMCYAPRINELAIAMTYLLVDKPDPILIGAEMVKGFCDTNSMSELEVTLVPYLVTARLFQSICHANKRVHEGTATEYVLVSQKPLITLLQKWMTLNPKGLKDTFLQAAGFSIEPEAAYQLERRNRFFSPALSISFKEPIHMEQAAFQYMHDKKGNTYLDAYNNIPHVGHSHPNVSRALASQAHKLNTNTRYLYDSLADYSEHLLDYFPSHLSKVFYVNSGSAASDLATRLARNFSQRKEMMVMDHGYHGNTSNGIEISAYKFEGPGGAGASSHIHKLPLPKLYQGEFDSVKDYVDRSKEILEGLVSVDRIPAALIAEPISGCGGQVPIPPEYFKGLTPALKAKGILLISDEVQVGFGRLGNHFWGFEMLDVVPDIVVLGKPMGNGHPIGAVVTTPEIADAFANGMEFFSSFGGNPVSMEVGKAVLQTIEQEDLQKNAAAVGAYWHQCLSEIDSPWIGHLRNTGLFMGVEFTDPNDQSPATDFAVGIKNQMKDNFILTGTDGPFNNVLKMKPPLCFSKANVDTFMEVFQKVVKE